ncbi:CapA family protein [Desulforamulus reducens]|nr:CapA family protein [Desulforamulus reducens]
MNNKFLLFALSLGLIIVVLGCGPEKISSPPTTPPEPPPAESITISAAGDFLMHMPIIHAAQLPGGNYDFKPIFSEVRSFLSTAELTLVNLETRLAGKEQGYSGYPVFNCPEELAQNMKELGIDVVTTANNHSLDRGWTGIVKTLDHLEAAGLQSLGTYRSAEDAQRVFCTEIKGIKIGILNYTESTNGIPLPKGKDYAVDMIQSGKIYQDIEKLKAAKTDVIIAYIHFGTEYQRHPNESQRTLVENLFKQGVTIVFGDHVHVIQPMDLKVSSTNNEKKCFVAYSLGNFISNQSWRYSNCGLITNVKLTKEANRVTITNVDYVPVWVDTYFKNGQKKYRVLPVQKAIEDFETGRDPLLTQKDYQILQQVWQDTTALITEACPVISPRNVSDSSQI